MICSSSLDGRRFYLDMYSQEQKKVDELHKLAKENGHLFNRDLWSYIGNGKCDISTLIDELLKPTAMAKFLDYAVNFISTAGPLGGGKDGRWMLSNVRPPLLLAAMVRCPITHKPVKRLWACNTEMIECVPFPCQEAWESKFGLCGIAQLDSINTARTKGILASKHPKYKNSPQLIQIQDVKQAQSTMVYWGTEHIGTQYDHELVHMTPMQFLPRTFTEYQSRSMMPLPSEEHPQPHYGKYTFREENGIKKVWREKRAEFDTEHKRWLINPSGQIIFDGSKPRLSKVPQRFGYLADKLEDEEMLKQIRQESPKEKVDEKKKTKPKPKPAPNHGDMDKEEDKLKVQLFEPWTYCGKIQFDLQQPLCDYGFSLWYVMQYEIEEDTALVRYLREQLKVEVTVICVVCWMQQFVTEGHGTNTGWIVAVNYRINFDPQLEDIFHRLVPL